MMASVDTHTFEDTNVLTKSPSTPEKRDEKNETAGDYQQEVGIHQEVDRFQYWTKVTGKKVDAQRQTDDSTDLLSTESV